MYSWYLGVFKYSGIEISNTSLGFSPFTHKGHIKTHIHTTSTNEQNQRTNCLKADNTIDGVTLMFINKDEGLIFWSCLNEPLHCPIWLFATIWNVARVSKAPTLNKPWYDVYAHHQAENNGNCHNARAHRRASTSLVTPAKKVSLCPKSEAAQPFLEPPNKMTFCTGVYGVGLSLK